ncbi:hypothetical protein [Nocardia terpenica]|uniref:Nucleoside phosphorylase domain-containing protein n=1 Tax=Nocardia terpenica TaxID=455432 RepID=A0A164NGA0_9NOCA|nr:hypothetical protein [Nocardia terpenica]KZM74331.1 hypothetical protein AWN90_24880 [Nocardia terpenica]NQE93088.1 hypothetical protein [Nocardia terpenica]
MTGPGIVCTPLRSERAALRGTVSAPVVRTGRGPTRRPSWPAGGPIAIAGVAGALDRALRPGDLVVADEIRSAATVVPSPAAPLLHAALRRRGLRATLGPIYSAERVVDGPARTRLADTGAVAVDTESAFLADAADGRAVALRAIVDTPDAPLLRPGTPWRGVLALRALRAAAPVLDQWSAAAGDHEVTLGGPEVADNADLVLVLGAPDSPDVRRSAENRAAEGVCVHVVDDVGAVELRWLRGVRRIGVVADISAPGDLMNNLLTALSGLGPVQLRDLPREVS